MAEAFAARAEGGKDTYSSKAEAQSAMGKFGGTRNKLAHLKRLAIMKANTITRAAIQPAR
jgi:hypothetical protein